MRSACGNQAMLHLLGSSPSPAGMLQRKCECSPGGTECAECKKEHEETGLRRSAAPGSGRAMRVPSIVHEVLRSPGRPLDAATRSYMEPRFGHDFSDVRIHTDAKAAASADAVNAHAYTVGRNIVFANGRYSTGGGSPQLLAHELAHVVQQGNPATTAPPESIASPRSQAESEAETVGRTIAEGQVAPRQAVAPCSLMRLGANPDCSKAEADSIHQGIFDARGWLNKAIPRLEKAPLDAATLASLRRNFGPTFGVAANAQLIHDRLQAARNAVGTIPYSCAHAPADAICASGNCGYTPPTAGSHQATICADVTLTPTTSAVFRAGCVLHESFHATFAKMGVDFYSGWHGQSSSTAGYPGAGTDPLLNADSYTTLVMDLS